MADQTPPTDQSPPTSGDASQSPDDELNKSVDDFRHAKPQEAAKFLYKVVVLYLDQHPELLQQQFYSSEDISSLADRINKELGLSTSDTFQQLEAFFGPKQEYASFDSTKESVDQKSDPVMMFNGQFVHEVEDIRIDGAGIDFVFKRTYKNQVTYNGRLGFNWDHSYNLWLRVANNTIFRATGVLREDAYIHHQTFDYWVPPDGQHGIITESDPLDSSISYVWRAPSGDRFLYQQDPTRDFLHRIVRIEDKYGNYLHFIYFDDRPYLIHFVEVNHSLRSVEFHYDEQDRIDFIEDYLIIHDATGQHRRRWQYNYDDLGDLIAVTTPATERYPAGLTTCYEYSSAEFSPPFQHNLTRIIDPAGQLYLENEYGTDPGRLTANRVVRQRQGGGEATFEYEDVVQEFEFTHTYSEIERPAHQTLMVQRNGQPVHYVYNTFGNLLLREEYILQEGLPTLIRWRYRYNADGALVGTLSPDGVVTQYFYGREDYLRRPGATDEDPWNDDHLTPQARSAFGNLLAVVRRGIRYDFAMMNMSLGVWGDFFPDVLAPSGSDASGEPLDIITKFTYEPDFQQLLTSSDPRYTHSANPGDPETGRYRETLTQYTYRGRDPTDTRHLFLDHIQYPDTQQAAGLPLTTIVQQYPLYDEQGRLLRSIDPEGNVTELEYFPLLPLNDPEAVKEGYLKSKTIDPGGLAVTTGYEVNEVGVTTAISRPRAVGAPAGDFRTTFEVNALNQVVRTVESPPFSYETRSFYNKNGLLEREERDLRDEQGLPFAGGVQVRTFCYDEQSNLLEESIGGSDRSAALVTRYRYNESDKRVRTILPKGNQLKSTYEERLLEVSRTRGLGSPEASTVRTAYSNDGLPIKKTDGRGYVTHFRYDPFNRLTETVDPLGNITRLDYDKAGNLVVRQFLELQSDGVTYLLLMRSEYDSDELNRRIVERANLFRVPPKATDPIPGTIVTTQTFYDRKGRIVGTVNRNLNETTFDYDALDRKVTQTDALGNVVRFSYDADSNLIRRDDHERVTDPATGIFIREDVFSTLSSYDELDRMSSRTDSLGNTTTFFYDSRRSLRKQVDPLGNVKHFADDVYGRKVTEIAEMTTTGLGGGVALPEIITQFEYDPNGNMTALIDAKGNRTEYCFDALDRQSSIRYPDATTQVFRYDADDHLTLYKDNNGLQRLYTFDPLGRKINMTLDSSGLAPGLTIELRPFFEEFKYDGLGRVKRESNDYAQVERLVDSLGRSYQETITYSTPFPLPGAFTLQRQFDPQGNLFQLTYPSGRVIRYDLDKLDRIEHIENLAKGTNYQGSSVFPEAYDILRNEYRGLRKARTIFGNTASTDYAFDGNGRTIQIAHLASNDALTIQHLYDAASNMRIKNDITPSGNSGEAYKYDSLDWLTKVEERTIQPFNPSDFEPASVPLPATMLQGQTRIDALIGPLAQNPTDFTFQYDLVGNRQEEREPGQPAVSYTSNSLNQYVTVAGAGLRYDPNGNLTNDGSRHYFYDYRNQLVRVHDPAAAQDIAQFFYDVEGRQLQRVTGSQVTSVIFNGQNGIEEYRGGSVWAQYVNEYDLDSLCQIAVQADEYWHHKDIAQSIRLLTDPSGLRADQYDYDAFGKFRVPPSGPYNPFGYMSRLLDLDTPDFSLYWYRSRHYSTALGRFLQRDSILGIDAYNVYLAFGNNPLRFVDPIGQEKKPINVWPERSFWEEVKAAWGVIRDPDIDWHDVYRKIDLSESSESRLQSVISIYEQSGESPELAEKHARAYLQGFRSAGYFAGAMAAGPLAKATGLSERAFNFGRSLPGKIDPPPKLPPSVLQSAAQAERYKAQLAAEEIKGAPAAGSALKPDPAHRAGSFVVDKAAQGRTFTIRGDYDGLQKNLTQVEGELNGQRGIYEWIVEKNGTLSHQRFIPGGRITGFPNQVPAKIPTRPYQSIEEEF
jgi:RHS repeat-associated protein